ncbi:alpha/beta hydrolase [Arthrobacter sp. NPDC089319]|uniref:alpha/beta fold hydrolase n=1 Tax=Arthrobacter sp. NPDC089319 TaxID=3155915 RepID=UPI00341581F5
MATFVFIHGAGDVGWYWHLVEAQLRARGHDVVAPDLPSEDETKGLDETADAVVAEIGDRRDLVVVGQSFGGFTAPLIAARLPVKLLVYLAAMVPAPGERPADWWSNTGYGEAAKQQAAKDGGLTGNDDPFICFYNGVPRELAEEALSYERGQSEASQDKAWPLEAHPDVPTKFILCKDDRFFPADLFRRIVPERLGIVPDEIPGCHCVALSHPKELADQLQSYLGEELG